MDDLDELRIEITQPLINKLVLHADFKMRRLTWQGIPTKYKSTDPGGVGAQDIVQDSILLYLDGTRKWNKEKYETLELFLRSVIDSIVSNMVNSVKNRRTRDVDNEVNPIEKKADTRLSGVLDKLIVDQEIKKRVQELKEKALSDTLVTQIIECLEAGITKPEEMSEYLNINIKLIYDAKKRFHRKVDQLNATELKGARYV